MYTCDSLPIDNRDAFHVPEVDKVLRGNKIDDPVRNLGKLIAHFPGISEELRARLMRNLRIPLRIFSPLE